MCIGVRIRKARLAAGISQARLAELMGVTRERL
ncbi:MAG: helix-turn-helix transcriptional regulator [Gammaproteobacteria bacterium]|nr:helix-turn-helix transcriptional regulator [Gammaproteobacteria bacterium]